MRARLAINEVKGSGLSRARKALLLAFFLLGTAAGFSADAPGGFDSANKLYEEGKFSDAVAAYDKLIQSGTVSSAVYFNLGNAFFKSGQVGRAVAAYRDAEKVAPRDPDVRANLQFVRSHVQGPKNSQSFWQRSLAALTLNEWAMLTAVIFWGWLGLWILTQFRPALMQSLRTFLWCGGIATLAFGSCLSATWSSHSATTAIVVAKDVQVHNGPLEEASVGATVHDGAELVVLDTKDDWLQVRLDSQRIGWLKRDQTVLASGS